MKPADKIKMAQRHEEFLAALFPGGRKSAGSGSQWADKADGRQNHLTNELAFAWDGKSTTGKSIGISREMIDKITEEAHGERPLLGLRFYADERFDTVSYEWLALRAEDMGELLELAKDGLSFRAMAAPEEVAAVRGEAMKAREEVIRLTRVSESLQRQLVEVREDRADREAVRESFANPAQDIPDEQPGPPVPVTPAAPGVPRPSVPPPCILVQKQTDPVTGQPETRAFRWDERGLVHQITLTGDGSRLEQDAYGRNMLFLNGVRVRRGELWIDGRIAFRAPGIEEMQA